ncbi:ubiquitin-domain-containing protein [Auricularia subglabra TFB-10046 SS5]|nr:ubiquitin-domain-containing protein [Auricularia subglabra TFB-10046 SS5]
MLELVACAYACDSDGSGSDSGSVTISAVEPSPPPAVHRTPATPDGPHITIKTLRGQQVNVAFKRSDTIHTIKQRAEDVLGIAVDNQRLIYKGRQLEDHFPASDYGIVNGDNLTLVERLRGGKPVIYLFSPSLVDATVALDLVPEWSFSCLYPQGEGDGKQKVQWRVSVTGRDGILLDKDTGEEEAYLFWEALCDHLTTVNHRSNPQHIDTPPPSPRAHAFSPARPHISPENSVVLDIKDVPQYLRRALRDMGLHTEACTSFITYWLPGMQAHKHLALRFLPQADYEATAKLRITPTPDVVTRVFMLFRGISEEDLPRWQPLASKVIAWPEVIGVDATRAKDDRLFRVLEWGGMEVK